MTAQHTARLSSKSDGWLRDVLEGRSMDELDRLIRRTLRESVAGASPPPHVWERIRVCAGRSTACGGRLGYYRVYRAVMAWRSRADAFLYAQIASSRWPQNEGGAWRCDPYYARLLTHGFLLRLAF